MKNGNLDIINFIKVIYQPIKNENKLRILSQYFINKNKDKCEVVYHNKKHELKECVEDIHIDCNDNDLIKFKLIFIHNIIDMSFMFYGCYSLISLSIVLNWNKFKVSGIRHMFNGCMLLKYLPDISK